MCVCNRTQQTELPPAHQGRPTVQRRLMWQTSCPCNQVPRRLIPTWKVCIRTLYSGCMPPSSLHLSLSFLLYPALYFLSSAASFQLWEQELLESHLSTSWAFILSSPWIWFPGFHHPLILGKKVTFDLHRDPILFFCGKAYLFSFMGKTLVCFGPQWSWIHFQCLQRLCFRISSCMQIRRTLLSWF